MYNKVTIKEAKDSGFIIDYCCYPHVGYKGARFAPTDILWVYTEEEAKFLNACHEALDQLEDNLGSLNCSLEQRRTGEVIDTLRELTGREIDV